MAWIPAAIGAAGVIGGGLLGNSAQAQANDTNMRMAEEQMEFQERQSNTAYQRATSDMKAAGLNPMLAYSQGGASSSPGAMARVEPVNSLANAVSTAASVAAEVSKKVAEVKTETERPAQIRQEVSTSAASADNLLAQTSKAGYEMNKLVEETKNAKTENGRIVAAIDLIKQQANAAGMSSMHTDVLIDKAHEEIKSIGIDNFLKSLSIPEHANASEMSQTWWGKVVPYLKSLSGPVSTAAGAYVGAKAGRKSK